MSDEAMTYDVVIVGAGPSGLAAAIKLKQLAAQNNTALSVCVLEKGSDVGAHILSGAVMETRALDELIPDWKEKGAPLHTPATKDQFMYLTAKNSYHLPVPPQMHNKGNYIVSLGEVAKWLASQAQELGVDIFPGFAAAKILYNDQDQVCGVETGPMGLDKEGNPGDQYQPGVPIYGKITLLGEGCRGSLTKTLFQKFKLERDCDPQTYGLGIKELWEVTPENAKPGKIIHTIGWPLDKDTYGGSFIYHLKDNLLAIGFVVGLDYKNPYLSPFEEFQRFKNHPAIRYKLEGGKRISYGARALNEGGFQSIPALQFPGGALVGCGAGFMNVPKIKGSHTAMKSGMVAAEAAFAHLTQGTPFDFEERLKKSWVYEELHKVRNIRPGFQKGLWKGLLNAAFESYITRGKSPWTLKNHADYKQTAFAEGYQRIVYPKPDGEVTFDRLSSVYLSNLSHGENQPCHLHLKDPERAIEVNYKEYASPETRYCPAGVYEVIIQDQKKVLQINAANCVHCKTCDIKDPTQNINWTPPEGGSGPNYTNM